MKTIFITAILNIGYATTKTIDFLFEQFDFTCQSGIPLFVFTSIDFLERLQTLKEKYHNILHIEILNYSQLYTNDKFSELVAIKVPEIRNVGKDTFNYMVLMNSKFEFLKRAKDILNNSENPENPNFYSWLDFGLFHVLHNKEEGIQKLQEISSYEWKTPLIRFPGCWSKGQNIEDVYKRINWRFCGGFFIMDSETLDFMYNKFFEYFEIFRVHNRIVWEVNLWALMEEDFNIDFGWFKGDHNNTILNVPFN